MQMRRRCAAAAWGPAPPSPPRSPPCPRRYGTVGLTPSLRRRRADALLPEPSTTRCVPDALRRWGCTRENSTLLNLKKHFELAAWSWYWIFSTGALQSYLSMLSSPRLLEESLWGSAASPPSSPVVSVWFSNCWMMFLTLPGRTAHTDSWTIW